MDMEFLVIVAGVMFIALKNPFEQRISLDCFCRSSELDITYT